MFTVFTNVLVHFGCFFRSAYIADTEEMKPLRTCFALDHWLIFFILPTTNAIQGFILIDFDVFAVLSSNLFIIFVLLVLFNQCTILSIDFDRTIVFELDVVPNRILLCNLKFKNQRSRKSEMVELVFHFASFIGLLKHYYKLELFPLFEFFH